MLIILHAIKIDHFTISHINRLYELTIEIVNRYENRVMVLRSHVKAKN